MFGLSLIRPSDDRKLPILLIDANVSGWVFPNIDLRASKASLQYTKASSYFPIGIVKMNVFYIENKLRFKQNHISYTIFLPWSNKTVPILLIDPNVLGWVFPNIDLRPSKASCK